MRIGIDKYNAIVQYLFYIIAMRHQLVAIHKLTERLRQAARDKTHSEIAAAANVDPSRVSRFLNGEFKKMTPVLKKVCGALKISIDSFLLEEPRAALSDD